MPRLGLRSRRGIGQAVRWTVTTPAGRWFVAARLGAIATAVWVKSQHGDTPAVITLVIAVIVAGLAAPPPPDNLGDARDPDGAGISTR